MNTYFLSVESDHMTVSWNNIKGNSRKKKIYNRKEFFEFFTSKYLNDDVDHLTLLSSSSLDFPEEYTKKKWLIDVSRKVQRQSKRYQKQYWGCHKELEKGFFSRLFS